MNQGTLESARRLSQGVAATLSDSEKEAAESLAAIMVGDIREMCEESADPAEVSVYVAEAITSILATVNTTPIGQAADLIHNNMCAYALAAGALAGEYALPEVEGSDSAPRGPAPDLSPEWRQLLDTEPNPQIGQYL